MKDIDKPYDSFTEETGEQPTKRQTIECEKSFEPIVQYSFNENYVRWLESRLVKIERFLQEFCENEIADCEQAVEEVTDGSEDIFRGRQEICEYILRAKYKGWIYGEKTNPDQQELEGLDEG